MREAIRLRSDTAALRAELAGILESHALAAGGDKRLWLLEQATLEYGEATRLEPNVLEWLAGRARIISRLAEFDGPNAVAHLNSALAVLQLAHALDETDVYLPQQQAEPLRRRAEHETGAERQSTLAEAEAWETRAAQLKRRVSPDPTWK